jgi:hypothetical protein
MAKAKSFDIIAIIDASGSMHPLVAETISGYNSFLDEQAKVKGKGSISLILFPEPRVVYKDVDVKYVRHLDEVDYAPAGFTPLYDAIGLAITEYSGTADKVVCLVITDGQENASHRFDQKRIRQLIEQKKAQGWEFVFLGANVEKQVAYDIGFDRGSTFGYFSTSGGTRALYGQVANSMTMTRGGFGTMSSNVSQEALTNPN